MNMIHWPKRSMTIVGILILITLILSLLFGGLNGWGSSDIFTGIGLMLVIGAMYYLQRMEIISERGITKKIKAEYSSESQPQVFEIYKHLKTKELEYLFAKILDDAKGDLSQVKKLASVAESIGWKAFLENRW